MFRMTSSSPCEIQGTIQLRNKITGLGPVTDIRGVRWDIHGIIGNYVQACKMDDLHSYYTDTSGASFGGFGTDSESGFVQQTWKPYNVEVIKDAD